LPPRRDDVTDLQESLYWLRLVQLLLAIPLLALVGQGLVWALARGFGQPPSANLFYRLLALIASPATRLARFVTPRFIADRHVPLVAVSLLVVAYAATMLAIAGQCLGAGVPVARCLQSR
jgi:hypothetical protein